MTSKFSMVAVFSAILADVHRMWTDFWHGAPRYDLEPFYMAPRDIEADSGYTDPGYYFVWDRSGRPLIFGPYSTFDVATRAKSWLTKSWRGEVR